MQIEIRADSAVIKGYVNTVERDSRELYSPKGIFVEQVRSGAWKKAIESRSEVFALLNHDKEEVLGSTTNNLKLREDNIGLYAELRTSDPKIIEKAKRREFVGWSFGFKPEKQSWGKTDNGVDRRYLDEIDLREVSVLDKTRTPAYYGTSVETREGNLEYIELRSVDGEVDLFVEKETENRDLGVENKLKLLEIENEL